MTTDHPTFPAESTAVVISGEVSATTSVSIASEVSTMIMTTQEAQHLHPDPSKDYLSRPSSKAEDVVESLEERAALEKESSSETASEEELDQEEAGEEEEEEECEGGEDEEEGDDTSSYTSSSSSYTESFISDDDFQTMGTNNDHDLLDNVPESIFNDTSFGDMADHAKEDLVDDELQCLLCNNFDHLIPRLDIAIKLEPVVGEPISKSSVLLCTQCDLMVKFFHLSCKLKLCF